MTTSLYGASQPDSWTDARVPSTLTPTAIRFSVALSTTNVLDIPSGLESKWVTAPPEVTPMSAKYLATKKKVTGMA